MTQILASGKTGSVKYDLLSNDPQKILTRLDVRSLAEDLQFFYNTTQGYCQSGDEGKADAINTALSVINASNLSSFSHKYTQALNTLISFSNFLDTDSATTANSIILKTIKITDEISPDGVNYSQENPLPFAFKNNLTFRFKAKYTNTGAVQIQINNFAGLTGAVSLLNESGGELVAGDIKENKYYTIIANSVVVGEVTTNRFLLKSEVRQASSTSFGLTYLNQPITIANNTTDANNDIDFTAGNFKFDDKSGEALVSAMTKRLDANWTAGNNGGGLFSGTKQANTWYHCYAITNQTTQVSDFGFYPSSLDVTSVLPSGFTKFSRRGSIKTDGDGNIILFRQNQDDFAFKTTNPTDFFGAPPSSKTPLTVSVPLGIICEYRFVAKIVQQGQAVDRNWYFYDPNGGLNSIHGIDSSSNVSVASLGTYRCYTNTSAQIIHQMPNSISGCTILQLGWKDITLNFK